LSLTLWLGFLATVTAIAVSPGPGAVISMSAGLRYGYWPALRAILGLQAALILQLTIVAGGLGALLATSALAFDFVKFVGAAYLIWIGLQKWQSSPQEIDEGGAALVPRGLFLQGLLVNLSNPKAIIFVAALVPQFIDPLRPQVPQILLLGLTMCVVDTLVMSAYALLVSRLRRWLHDPKSLRAQNRLFGGIFVAAGILLATSERH
jgi:homoserine/homoserine lactone efflux protein